MGVHQPISCNTWPTGLLWNRQASLTNIQLLVTLPNLEELKYACRHIQKLACSRPHSTSLQTDYQLLHDDSWLPARLESMLGNISTISDQTYDNICVWDVSSLIKTNQYSLTHCVVELHPHGPRLTYSSRHPPRLGHRTPRWEGLV